MTSVTKDVAKANKLLLNGAIVAIPTETVYGLAANVYNILAVQEVFAMKGRPVNNPLIVHISSFLEIHKVATDIPDIAIKLAFAFWPGPLTLILRKHPSIPDIISAGKDTVGVRIPDHPLTLSLLKMHQMPLAAPSANHFGCISPTQPSHVLDSFEGRLQLILDGGICRRGVESTIVGFRGGQPVLHRMGAISQEQIEEITGKLSVEDKNDSNPVAPGMMLKHYSPSKKTVFTDDLAKTLHQFSGKKIGLLTFADSFVNCHIVHQEVLSQNNDLVEACSNLYAALHRLDQSSAEIIIGQKFPDVGLGRTINDRLQRASA